jgi:hypothetical protein
MAEEKKIICPECGQADAVQKLSAVYAEGMFTLSGASLDKKIGPPAKPKFNGLAEKVSKGVGKVVGSTFEHVGCLTGGLVWFLSFALPMIVWVYFTAWISFVVTGRTFDTHAQFSNIQVAIWLILLIVPPVVLSYLALRRRWRFSQEHVPPWLTAVEEWSKRLYCKRCNRSFASEAPIPLGPISIDWSGLEKTDAKEKLAAEKAVQTFLGIAKSSHCLACHGEMRGILFSNVNIGGLPVSARQKLGAAGFVCPTCGAFYCNKCIKEALGYKVMSGFTKAVCSSCKSPMPKPDVLVGTKAWYESFPLMIGAATAKKGILTAK